MKTEEQSTETVMGTAWEYKVLTGKQGKFHTAPNKRLHTVMGRVKSFFPPPKGL